MSNKLFPADTSKVREKIKTWVIIVLIIVIAIMLIRGCNDEGEKTVISEDKEVELKDTSDGQIRIKMNPVITINDGMMEDMGFGNYNENRLLKIKIKVGDEYIYESDYIKPSQVLEGDMLDNLDIDDGTSDAIAEVYSYTTDGTFIGQTNVALKLNNEG